MHESWCFHVLPLLMFSERVGFLQFYNTTRGSHAQTFPFRKSIPAILTSARQRNTRSHLHNLSPRTHQQHLATLRDFRFANFTRLQGGSGSPLAQGYWRKRGGTTGRGEKGAAWRSFPFANRRHEPKKTKQQNVEGLRPGAWGKGTQKGERFQGR
jgi:hypothetical protein